MRKEKNETVEQALDELKNLGVATKKKGKRTGSSTKQRKNAMVPLETLMHWKRTMSAVLDAVSEPYIPTKLLEAWKLGRGIEKEMELFL